MKSVSTAEDDAQSSPRSALHCERLGERRRGVAEDVGPTLDRCLVGDARRRDRRHQRLPEHGRDGIERVVQEGVRRLLAGLLLREQPVALERVRAAARVQEPACRRVRRRPALASRHSFSPSCQYLTPPAAPRSSPLSQPSNQSSTSGVESATPQAASGPSSSSARPAGRERRDVVRVLPGAAHEPVRRPRRERPEQVEVRLEEVVVPADDRQHRGTQPLRLGEHVERAPVVVVVGVLQPLAVLDVTAALEQPVVGDRQARRDVAHLPDRRGVLGLQRRPRLLVDVEPRDRLRQGHVRPVDVPAELEGAARVDPAVVDVGARAEHRARPDLGPVERRQVERRARRVRGAVDADPPVAPRLRAQPVEAVPAVVGLVHERVPRGLAARAPAHFLDDDRIAAPHRVERVHEQNADDEARRPAAADPRQESRERPLPVGQVDVGREPHAVAELDHHVALDPQRRAHRRTEFVWRGVLTAAPSLSGAAPHRRTELSGAASSPPHRACLARRPHRRTELSGAASSPPHRACLARRPHRRTL